MESHLILTKVLVYSDWSIGKHNYDVMYTKYIWVTYLLRTTADSLERRVVSFMSANLEAEELCR